MAAPSALAEYRPSDQQLRYLGAALAYVVAAIHLFHPRRGFPRLVQFASSGNIDLIALDPRPLLFVLSGVAILVAVKLVLVGYPRRPVYAAGMALMATYVVGYFAWHLSGHGGFLPGRRPLYHGIGPVEAVVSHLRSYPLARVSKVAEIALFVVLGVLYRREGSQ